MLCTACQNIFRGRLISRDDDFFEIVIDGAEISNDDEISDDDERSIDHHLTAQSFAQAVSQHCYICTYLYRSKGSGATKYSLYADGNCFILAIYLVDQDQKGLM